MGFNLPFAVMRLYSTIWMRAKARVVVKGLEDLPPKAKGEKRVYVVLNHSTTFDCVALMHVSKEPFSIMMDAGAFSFPIVRRILRGAGFIPLDEEDSKPCIASCVEAVNAGKPLIVSLYDGHGTVGDRGRPRTGGIRIAHMTGAKLCPVFLKVENDRIRRLSFKGVDGERYHYSTFKDSFYFIEFLKPVDLSALPSEPGREGYAEIANSLGEATERLEARYDAYLEDNRERFAPLKRRGGTKLRVAW